MNEPVGRIFTEALVLPAGSTEEVTVSYNAVGQTNWIYDLSQLSRMRNVDLTMSTNFEDIDFPAGSSSALDRPLNTKSKGWNLQWKYSDVIGIRSIGMAMPKVLNPAPVASRISFFAPVSLVFFFAVLIILSMVKKITLHPMNYFFLSAGGFAFQLLFAYLLDQLSIHLAFGIAASVSLALLMAFTAKMNWSTIFAHAPQAQS
jgi:hypothetical protein